jgi:hypothetical protein
MIQYDINNLSGKGVLGMESDTPALFSKVVLPGPVACPGLVLQRSKYKTVSP